MNSAMEIRKAVAADLVAARSWLSEAGLPIEDLTPDHMQNFLVTMADHQPVGMIGLEQFGKTGLLRSLIVDPSVRSEGLGAQLVGALERRAAESGVNELWLLTIDADRYFANLGYEAEERSAAPQSIRATDEFSTLCPGDAVLMRKTL